MSDLEEHSLGPIPEFELSFDLEGLRKVIENDISIKIVNETCLNLEPFKDSVEQLGENAMLTENSLADMLSEQSQFWRAEQVSQPTVKTSFRDYRDNLTQQPKTRKKNASDSPFAHGEQILREECEPQQETDSRGMNINFTPLE